MSHNWHLMVGLCACFHQPQNPEVSVHPDVISSTNGIFWANLWDSDSYRTSLNHSTQPPTLTFKKQNHTRQQTYIMVPPPVTDDYYEVLEVTQVADELLIKASYRCLAKLRHPDKNPNDPTAKARFQLVSSPIV